MKWLSQLPRKGFRFLSRFLVAIKVGWFLAIRELRRTSIWSTLLIIVVMMLTFLNLIVVRGILVGLVEGAIRANRAYDTGDILITNFNERDFIEEGAFITAFLEESELVKTYSPRYQDSAIVEANYQDQIRLSDDPDSVSAVFLGLDPELETRTTGIDQLMTAGSFLEAGDTDSVVLGEGLIEGNSFEDNTLSEVTVGEKIRLRVNGQVREVTLKGVLKTKVQELDQSVIMIDSQARNLLDRDVGSYNKIIVRLNEGLSPDEVKAVFLANELDTKADVETYIEAFPSFVSDIQQTFDILANVIGGIGLIVASITIFIVIFVNAVTRRKYIGILKGIGVSSIAVEAAYVFQALFYSSVGIILGLLITYGFLVDYFLQNPINFPFSDGVLLAPWSGSLLRSGILLVTTMIAGFVPAFLVVQGDTLDAILGR